MNLLADLIGIRDCVRRCCLPFTASASVVVVVLFAFDRFVVAGRRPSMRFAPTTTALRFLLFFITPCDGRSLRRLSCMLLFFYFPFFPVV